METVWFTILNPLDLTDVMYFEKYLMNKKIPFSVEYDGCKVGVSGFSMEKHQLDYWKM